MKTTKKKLIKVFEKLINELCQCDVCGEFITKEEYTNGDGACSNCWEK